MPLVLADRVQETSTTSGTGTLTLNGAVNGYQSFANGVGNGNTCYYTIYDTVAYTWEVGIGTYTSGSPNTLTRTTVLSNSSQTTSLINFAGNLMNVWVDYPAEKAIYQDASGNTYVPSLGGTTPSTGTFTTITGQTETLKGTGENLVLQSQALATSPWTPNGITATNNSATAPDSTNTASLITASAGTSAHYDFSGGTPVFNQSITYTVSFYAKSGTTRYVQFAIGGTGSIYANFDTTAGTVGTTAGLTSSSITSAGSGWYRCVVVFSYSSTGASGVAIAIQSSSSDTRLQSWTAAGTETVYIWGVQTEIGSVANTYIPTTTTAIYGTPTLSFSGVSTIGLQNDGALFVQPAGTGALQAQQTTSSATGGNARGANAVDWQTSRTAATQVTSGTQATISGGINNTVSSQYGVIGGGTTNTGGFATTISGGSSNNSNNVYTFVGGGTTNTANGNRSLVVGGESNSASGILNFIGGGYTNSGTANAAVTTQATSTITSGSTAVTLSGTNASIKVGQYITGTPIANQTYVAAISGTSLTLSQNATSSTNATLSFYTPHGVVVGGGNNQATGSYSFIGGGGDAGTAANRNIASGDWSFVGGGIKNTASGVGSVVVGGGWSGGGAINPNTASNSSSFVGAGYTNTSSGVASVVTGGINNNANATGSSIIGGGNNVANANYSSVVGGNSATTRGIIGNTVFAASSVPISNSSAGISQAALLILGIQTTTATTTVLTSDTNSAGTTNQIILPNNSAYYVVGTIIAGVTGGGNTSAWNFVGAIKRGANAGSTAIVGTGITATLVSQDAGASGWAVSITADTTNGGLAVTVTGQASTTIRWVCKVETTEMTF